MADQEVDGVQLLVESLKIQGVEHLFGVVGIPIVEVAVIAQQNGIKFYAMRNEQAACYAAQAMGYLTRRPGVCLVVSGPGVLHAIGGLANAKENCWPLVLLGGASDTDQEAMGAFQECPQVEACRPYCKFSARPSSVEAIPYIVHQAFKKAAYGRPGPAYIDLPGNFLRATLAQRQVEVFPRVPEPPVSLACPSVVREAAHLLQDAKTPLAIIGKGAAFARAEQEVTEWIQRTSIPFLPTPMGKGVVSDSHPLCVSAARTLALLKADVILLVGARLNWILHFGRPPRFRRDVKFIQIDIYPEEFYTSVGTSLTLCGDIKSVMKQLINSGCKASPHSYAEWFKQLRQKMEANIAFSREMEEDESVPLNYYTTFRAVQEVVPPNCFFVSEGANTMDIGRAYLLNRSPRHRLDAGTFGTMGVGLGFAIAAALWCNAYEPETRVICVEGDSAFGFSAMEIETIYRYRLPIIIIVINNNGIYGGLPNGVFNELSEGGDRGLSLPPTSLKPDTHYENLAHLFEDEGSFCETTDQIREALRKALSDRTKPSLINIMINPFSQRKAQNFDWLTRSKL